jgi:hypothetical protein
MERFTTPNLKGATYFILFFLLAFTAESIAQVSIAPTTLFF